MLRGSVIAMMESAAFGCGVLFAQIEGVPKDDGMFIKVMLGSVMAVVLTSFGVMFKKFTSVEEKNDKKFEKIETKTDTIQKNTDGMASSQSEAIARLEEKLRTANAQLLQQAMEATEKKEATLAERLAALEKQLIAIQNKPPLGPVEVTGVGAEPVIVTTKEPLVVVPAPGEPKKRG